MRARPELELLEELDEVEELDELDELEEEAAHSLIATQGSLSSDAIPQA